MIWAFIACNDEYKVNLVMMPINGNIVSIDVKYRGIYE